MPRDPLLKKSAQRIGEILVKRGWISNEALGRALDQQALPTGKRVGEILQRSGQISEVQLAQALAEQYGLTYVDLQHQAEGWRIDRDIYTFKWKHLSILPMRDPQGNSWLLITEATADEKLMLPSEGGLDMSRLKFGVVAATVLEQVLAENPPANELVYPPVPQQVTMPPAPDPVPEGAATRVPSGLARLTVPRLLTMVGALWSQSAAELERNAVILLMRGPHLRVEVREIVRDAAGDLPPGYVHLVTSHVGRAFDVEVTVPYASVEGASAELDWPVVWPPPDLVDSVGPLLSRQCRVPPALRRDGESLRWMGTRSKAREELNRHLVTAAGVSLGHARIDDVPELWEAIRARARGLDANQAARLHWDRWKALHAPHLEIAPGHVLALASLATGSLPRALAPTLTIEHTEGPVFAVELYQSEGRPAIRVTTTSRSQN